MAQIVALDSPGGGNHYSTVWQCTRIAIVLARARIRDPRHSLYGKETKRGKRSSYSFSVLIELLTFNCHSPLDPGRGRTLLPGDLWFLFIGLRHVYKLLDRRPCICACVHSAIHACSRLSQTRGDGDVSMFSKYSENSTIIAIKCPPSCRTSEWSLSNLKTLAACVTCMWFNLSDEMAERIKIPGPVGRLNTGGVSTIYHPIDNIPSCQVYNTETWCFRRLYYLSCI